MSTVVGVQVTGPTGELRAARGDAPAPGRWDDPRAPSTEMALAASTPAP